MYRGSSERFSGATMEPEFCGKFCAILNAWKMSTVALMKASLASDKLEVSERSTAILASKPTMHWESAEYITSDRLEVTGMQSVCTRIRLSALLLVYSKAAWKHTDLTSAKLSS